MKYNCDYWNDELGMCILILENESKDSGVRDCDYCNYFKAKEETEKKEVNREKA